MLPAPFEYQPAPFAHQLAGKTWAAQRNASFLAHEMGCGKTRTAIMLADDPRYNVRRILVICPSIATGVWREEFRKWGTVRRSMQIIRRGAEKPMPTAGLIIIGYDLLSRSKTMVGLLMEQEWDLIVLDEAHALKERKSKRTKAIYGNRCHGTGIVSRARKVILLSGTPMLNHPAELWTHMRALVPHTLRTPDFSEFVTDYCETKSVWIGNRHVEKIVGAKREAMRDLRRRLENFIHRVRKSEVLKDLPPMTWSIWPVGLSDCNPSKDELIAWKAAEKQLQNDTRGVQDEDMLDYLKGSPHAATQRRLTGILKVRAAVRAIREELEGNPSKVVVFAHHTAVIDTLLKELAAFNPVAIDGRTPTGLHRDNLVQAFQNNPECRVFIGQNVAASTAVTLTAAASVWLIEPDWTPAINAQAAARCHRPGQMNPVTVRVMALDGSIDFALMSMLARKSADIAAVIERGDTGSWSQLQSSVS